MFLPLFPLEQAYAAPITYIIDSTGGNCADPVKIGGTWNQNTLTCTLTSNKTVNNLTIESGGTLDITNGVTFTITGTLTNNGIIENKGTLDNDGIIENKGSITNEGSIDNRSHNIINNGTIEYNDNGNTIVYGTSTSSNNQGNITNHGTITLNHGYFTNIDGNIENHGTVNVQGDSHIQSSGNNSIINNYDIFFIGNNARADGDGEFNNDGGKIINNGILSVVTLINTGNIENQGIFGSYPGANMENNGTIVNDFIFRINGILTNESSVINNDKIEIKETGTIENNSSIENNGIIQNDGSIKQTCDSQIIGLGSIDGNPIENGCPNGSPEITVQNNIIKKIPSNENRTTVTFAVTATDNEDGNVPVTCTPPSGSFFNVDTTTVTCTATDSSNNTSFESFTVTITNQDATVPPPPDRNKYGFTGEQQTTEPPVIQCGINQILIDGKCITSEIKIGEFDVNVDNSDENIRLRITGNIDSYEVKSSREFQFSIVDSNGLKMSDAQIDKKVSVDSFGILGGFINLKEEWKSGTYEIYGMYDGKDLGSDTFTIITIDVPPVSKDDDGDGIPNDIDVCPQEPEDLDGVEDKDGCPDTLPQSNIFLDINPSSAIIFAGEPYITTFNVDMSGITSQNISLSCNLKPSPTTVSINSEKISCTLNPDSFRLDADSPPKTITLVLTSEREVVPDTYDYRIVAKSNIGNVNYASFSILVKDIPPKITIKAPSEENIDTEIEFEAQMDDPSGLIEKLEWDFGDNTPKKIGPVVTHQYSGDSISDEKIFTVRLTPFSDGGDELESISHQITIAKPELFDPTILAIIGTIGGIIIGIAKLFVNKQKSSNKPKRFTNL